jgi:hypothetical protein
LFARILAIQVRRLILRAKQSLAAVRGWYFSDNAKDEESVRWKAFKTRRKDSRDATPRTVSSTRRDSEPAWRFSAVTGTLGLLLMLFLLISSLISASVPQNKGNSEATTREKNLSLVSNSPVGDETTVASPATSDHDDPFATPGSSAEEQLRQPLPRAEEDNDNPSAHEHDALVDDSEISSNLDLDVELERIAPSVVSDGAPLDSQDDEEFFVTSESSFDKFSHVESVGTNSEKWKQYTRTDNRLDSSGQLKESVVATVPSSASAALSTLVQGAQLQLAISIPQRVSVGQPCQLQYTVSNRGPVKATKVVLSSSLSPMLVHPKGRRLDHKIGTLQAGEVYVARLTVRATSTGEAISRAEVVAAGGLSKRVEKRFPVSPKAAVVRGSAGAHNSLPRCCFIAR